MLANDFAGKSAVLDNFNIVNLQYSDQYAAQVEAKVVAQQQALTEQNKLQAVQFQAQQRVAQAQGEADAIKAQISAISAQGGANYLTMLWIQKWNGQVSIVNGGSSIVDLRGINSAGYIATTPQNISNTTS
jgi:regulator of protease activity HflC (stomatin/prohibitin superfamily)